MGLVPIDSIEGFLRRLETATPRDLAVLRDAAHARGNDTAAVTSERVRELRTRSRAVREYALTRAKGLCEACGNPAPFCGTSGLPFLEVPHIDRLSDNGPDRIDRVAGICPNCHRRCHFGKDAHEYNLNLRSRISEIERRLENTLLEETYR